MAARRWQDRANLVLGAWLLVSPWVLDYVRTTAAWNAYFLGAGIFVVAVIARYVPKGWEELINTALGVWLVVSPFVLGFTSMETVALHTVVVGILVAALAIWAMWSDKPIYKRWRRSPSA